MSTRPFKIVAPRMFAAELGAQLTVGHVLVPFGGETDAAMAALLADADVLISGAYKAGWKPPAGSPLRLIHSTGAGVDGIHFPSVPAGCTVCNVYGHERGVAEQAFMHMLALHKGLFRLDAALRQGDWTPSQTYLPEMIGRRLLILGAGQIGQALVRWGGFLGMEVTVLTRRPDPTRAGPGVRKLGGLDELSTHLPEADFVVVAIPAAPGTIDLISAREFALMKRSAIIVNVGRGPVINEEALYEALRTRRIAGAGIDVWYQYPSAPGQIQQPGRFPFHALDNIIMTPHKPTVETMAYRWRAIANNVSRLVQGEPLLRVVQP
jgi:phosphoglycerate dehydrogenase-like enzyme